MLVGFPNETDEDFDELVDFIKWARFERLGAFAYSEEEGTFSANHYADNIPDEVKQKRLDYLMEVQQDISAELEAEKIGKVMTVIIDRKEGLYYVGRTDLLARSDPEVLIPAGEKMLRVGNFYQVKIVQAEEFDLYGEIV